MKCPCCCLQVFTSVVQQQGIMWMIGLMWTKTTSHLTPAPTTWRWLWTFFCLCRHILTELIETERLYVEEIQSIIEVQCVHHNYPNVPFITIKPTTLISATRAIGPEPPSLLSVYELITKRKLSLLISALPATSACVNWLNLITQTFALLLIKTHL